MQAFAFQKSEIAHIAFQKSELAPSAVQKSEIAPSAVQKPVWQEEREARFNEKSLEELRQISKNL